MAAELAASISRVPSLRPCATSPQPRPPRSPDRACFARRVALDLAVDRSTTSPKTSALQAVLSRNNSPDDLSAGPLQWVRAPFGAEGLHQQQTASALGLQVNAPRFR